MSALNLPQYQDADKAREFLESVLWPNGPVCPHCGSVSDQHYQLKGKGGEKRAAHRPGLWMCKDCREQFTVTVGTVFERSKIKLNVWLQAVFLLCSSKKGMSAHQLHRTLGVTYKTAWFMCHRIRTAFRDGSPHLLGGQFEPINRALTPQGMLVDRPFLKKKRDDVEAAIKISLEFGRIVHVELQALNEKRRTQGAKDRRTPHQT